jgi:hypothetical protein
MLGHKVGEFVEEGAFHLTPAKAAELRVEYDLVGAGVCESRRGAHAPVPEYGNVLGEGMQAERV